MGFVKPSNDIILGLYFLTLQTVCNSVAKWYHLFWINDYTHPDHRELTHVIHFQSNSDASRLIL